MVCALLLTLLLCKARNDRQQEAKQERFQAGIRLTNMMCNGDFKLALLFLDTLKAKYPRDPQFPFAEGYIYDMQGNSIKARPAFEKSLSLYDSIIAADSNSGQEVNRLIILQILYGKEVYQKALERIIEDPKNRNDSIWWDAWRDFDYNSSKKELLGGEFNSFKDESPKE